MTNKDDVLYRKRHSIAHVLAEAVLQIFSEAKIAIGPPIKNGFYYDFDLPRTLKQEDLEEIENIMRAILKSGSTFEKEIITKEHALELFKNQLYKIDLIESFDINSEISIYKSHNFIDLCKGPHIDNMHELDSKSFKLTSIAGAYWRGNENNKMLQRIYGTLWNNEEELKTYLKLKEELKKRDHRKLGKELDLFSVHEEIGAGFIFWHPKGSRVRVEIENFWREEHLKNGYEIVFTPHIGKSWLWQTSGHLDFYKDNMFSPIEMDKSDYYVKPMNCPFHIAIYNNSKHSYRDLPLRWAELGTVYRYEKLGVLQGTMRVRGFTQDDAHIICTPDQVGSEIEKVIKFSLYMWKNFGFKDLKAYISTRPKKYVGNMEDWNKAEEALEEALKQLGLDYEFDHSGGAFYGPKIDIKVRDSLERDWQMSTIQFDFNLPEKFKMSFIAEDGQKKKPYMIHRALLGSLERFFGILIEHYSGAFPVWLAPVQVVIIPINGTVIEYAQQILNKMQQEGIRIKLDLDQKLGMNAKIRKHQVINKIPYVFMIGKKELDENKISIRTRTGEKINDLTIEAALSYLKNKIILKEVL